MYEALRTKIAITELHVASLPANTLSKAPARGGIAQGLSDRGGAHAAGPGYWAEVAGSCPYVDSTGFFGFKELLYMLGVAIVGWPLATV